MASQNVFEKGKWIDPPQLMNGYRIHCNTCDKYVLKSSLKNKHQEHDVEWRVNG